MNPFTSPDGPPMRPRQGSAVVALFDGECGICSRSAAWFAVRDVHGNVERLDLRNPLAAERFPSFDADAVRALMHVIDGEGKVIIGLDAARAVLAQIPRWGWIARVLGLPVIHAVASLGYRWFAGNRLWFNRFISPVGGQEEACDGDACAIDWEALARSEAAHRE